MAEVKLTSKFKQAYKELNPEQKKAVDTIDGPVMVIAGPGTGKTRIITNRIANILSKTDSSPSSIVALTFTEAAAKEMRNRLRKLIGRTAYYVQVATFHSFCTEVIRENADLFNLNPSVEPLSDLDRVKIIHDILDSHDFKKIRPVNAPYLYTKALLSAIDNLKREAINPQELEDILNDKQVALTEDKDQYTKTELRKEQKDLAKNRDVLKAYRAYQESLRDNGWFDFSDMINFVTEKFEQDEEFLRSYQERYHYFLVDEYQDTNTAQNQVVDLLASFWGEQANVFVVGDPNQSIFRFQGASLENMASFIENYPQAEIITLKYNYRSNQKILDAGKEVIEHNKMKIENILDTAETELQSQMEFKEQPVKVARLASAPAEIYFITEKIKKLINKGVDPDEIAVIYRNNADAREISEALAKYNIKYITQGGGNILEYPVIQKLIKVLRTVYQIRDKQEDIDLFTIMHYPFFNIDNLDILKLSRQAATEKTSIFDLIIKAETFKKIELNNPKSIKKFINLLLSWEKEETQKTFSAFFEQVLNESGLLDWALNQPDSTHLILRLNTLFSEVKKMNSADHKLNLEGFLKNIDLMEENYLKIPEPVFAEQEDSVTLTTAHSAKGLEWEYVFIYRAYDGRWGNNRSWNLISLPEEILPNSDLSKKEKNEDERRLFYVASTRAKKEVTVTQAQRYFYSGRAKETVPTMFLEEIGDENKKIIAVEKINEQAHQNLSTFLSQAQEIQAPEEDEKDFLKQVIDNFKMSPTALNTYLKCPYKFKLNNLLRVPRAKAPYLAFGTAVHQALENFNQNFIKTEKLPQKQFLLTQFEKALNKEILTPKEAKERYKKGIEYLDKYYQRYKDEFIKPAFAEKYLGYGNYRIAVDDIPIVGKVDKIDWLDKTARTVKVIDYKTGAPKTRGQIKGTTKYSDGEYKRQLVFYKLLVDSDPRLNMTVRQGELDFIQTDSRGSFRKERFELVKQEVENLKKTIRQTMEKIRDFQFGQTDDYHHCKHCEFKEHCFPEGIPDLPKRNN